MSKHSIWKNLSCDLTDGEVATYSQELAKITQTQAEIDAEKKEVMSKFTADLNKCIADSRVLARKITSRKEDRHVECDLDFDYSRGLVYTVRIDTGVTIDQRKLTDDERQQKIDFDGEQDKQQELQDSQAEVESSPVEDDSQDTESLPADESNFCVNTECEHHDDIEPNGCTECEYTYECDQSIQKVEGVITVEEHDRRDKICPEWHECVHAEKCMDDSINTECVCYVAEQEKLLATATELTIEDLMSWEFCRNESKILTAGFSLVKYDRDSKTLYTTAGDPRAGWQASGPFETFAAAERQLEYEIAAGFIHVAGNNKGTVSGHKCVHKLRDKGFEFYRHEETRIKYGSSWRTWKKFETAEECLSAWETLMTTHPFALED